MRPYPHPLPRPQVTPRPPLMVAPSFSDTLAQGLPEEMLAAILNNLSARDLCPVKATWYARPYPALTTDLSATELS